MPFTGNDPPNLAGRSWKSSIGCGNLVNDSKDFEWQNKKRAFETNIPHYFHVHKRLCRHLLQSQKILDWVSTARTSAPSWVPRGYSSLLSPPALVGIKRKIILSMVPNFACVRKCDRCRLVAASAIERKTIARALGCHISGQMWCEFAVNKIIVRIKINNNLEKCPKTLNSRLERIRRMRKFTTSIVNANQWMQTSKWVTQAHTLWPNDRPYLISTIFMFFFASIFNSKLNSMLGILIRKLLAFSLWIRSSISARTVSERAKYVDSIWAFGGRRFAERIGLFSTNRADNHVERGLRILSLKSLEHVIRVSFCYS